LNTLLPKISKSDFDRISNGIKRWRISTTEAALLIKEAHEKKIWSFKYDSFKEFCEKECGITKQWAYELLNTSKIIQKAGFKSLTHAQARALSDVDEDQREAVLKKAASKGGGKVTASSIKESAKSFFEDAEERDEGGWVIPESILEDWNRATTLSHLLTKISDVKCVVEEGFKSNDVCFTAINQNVLTSLKSLFADLKQLIPHAVCTTCQGHTRDKCTFCKGRGYLSEFLWKMAVPAEVKAIRQKAVK